MEITPQLTQAFESKKISIVIPMYNEEKTIGTVLDNIPKLPNYEIIVVDDGSIDNCKKLTQNYPGVHLICHEHNMGYGKSLIDGVRNVDGDIIVTIDSDGQHDPKDILSLIEPILLNRADITIGSRYLGEYYYALPLSTRLGEAFIEILIGILFGVRVKANQSGYRAFSREAVQKIFKKVRFIGFAFCTEAILRAKIAKYHIEEVAIHLHDRKHGHSRVKVVKLFLSLINCMSFYSLRKFFGKKVAKSYAHIIEKLHLSQFSKY